MYISLSKYATPLMLLFALVFLTGAASLAVASTGSTSAELCCENEAEQHAPATEGECADPSCLCLSCSVSTHSIHPQLFADEPEPSAPLWQLASGLSSDYIQSIDYPPETL